MPIDTLMSEETNQLPPARQILGMDFSLAILSAMSFIASLGIAIMVPLIPL